MIRVLILASSESERAALIDLLREDDRLDIIGQDEALTADVLLISGAQPPPQLATIPAVILTDDLFEQSDYRTSVRARLSSQATAAEVLATLLAAAQGLVVLTQAQADSLFLHPSVPQSPTPLLEELTPRELQVLRALALGLGNKEIADRLGISDHTAKFHVASILGKLQASSRTEAVTLGIRLGLIPI